MNCFLIALGLAMGQGEIPPAVGDLERRTIDHRRSIRQAKLVLRAVNVRSGEPNAYPSETFIWLDNDKIRCDDWCTFRGDKAPHRELSCRNCQLPGHFVRYHQLEILNVAVKVYPMPPVADPASEWILDPRCLGMVPMPSSDLFQCQLDSTLGRTDRGDISTRTDSWKGLPCQLIECENAAGHHTKVWIATDRGPSVVRIEITAGKLMQAVESELAMLDSGYWFPRRCEYCSVRDGKDEVREKVEVEVLSLNKPVDPAVFTLAGMNIQRNTPIVGISDEMHGPVVWDGSAVVSTHNRQLPDDIQEANRASHGRSWLTTLSVVSGAAAFLAFVVYVRGRKPTAPGRGALPGPLGGAGANP
jgi:hypothetical protein